MNRAILLVFILTTSFSWSQQPSAPAPSNSLKISLQCKSSPNAIGDTFEYEFKIEQTTLGRFELRDGSRVILHPLNINQGVQTAWQNVSVSNDQIEMKATQYNRLLEQIKTERFILDRKSKEFTLARSTQDITKPQAATTGLVQLQSGTCTEK